MNYESYFNSRPSRNEPGTHDSGVDGLHNENLFDQNERNDGARVNEATGLPYDNSTTTDETIILETGHIDPNSDVEQDTEEMDVITPNTALDANSDEVMDARTDAWLAEFDVELTSDDIPPGPIETKSFKQ